MTPCPVCGAKTDEPCVDFLGRETRTHSRRIEEGDWENA